MAAAAELSTMANTNDNQNLNERTNESSTSGGDSTAADGTGVSLSASAYEVIQQYSEAELHGEYESSTLASLQIQSQIIVSFIQVMKSC